MIKTVIFDLGGVIVPLDFARAYGSIGKRCPYPVDEVRKRIAATDLVVRFECGRISPQDFHQELATLLQLDATYGEFCEMWFSLFPPGTLIPEALLEQVHSRHRLLLLSNTNAIHFEMILAQYRLLQHFDDFVLSYKVGAMKPAEAIYREAIARAGCEPHECFYTDDIQAYVDGARSYGIDAVRFESSDQIRAELATRGVL